VDDGLHERLLGREVVVERPDAHAGDLGDPVRGRPVKTVANDGDFRRAEEDLDRVLGALLPGGTAGSGARATGHACGSDHEIERASATATWRPVGESLSPRESKPFRACGE